MNIDILGATEKVNPFTLESCGSFFYSSMKTALPTLTPILVRNQTVLWPLPKIQSIWCSQGKPRSGPPDSDGFVKYRLPAPAEFLLRRWLHRWKATRCTRVRNEDTLTKSTTSSCSRDTGRIRLQSPGAGLSPRNPDRFIAVLSPQVQVPSPGRGAW